ncbi:MAG: hypothetical protein ACREQY_20960 [Candidatus Binatia bacterium]
MRRRSGRALCLVGLLLLGSCGLSRSSEQAAPTDSGGSYGSGIDLEGLDGGGGSTGAGEKQSSSGEPRGGGDGGGSASAPGAVAPGQTGGARLIPRDRGAVGNNALVYLRPSFPKLAVEINAANGREPSAAALDRLRERLTSVVDKPAGIEFLPVNTFSVTRTEYSLDDVKAVEGLARKEWSTDDRVVIHLLYLNGRPSYGNALGTAYGASSIVVFPDRLENAVTPVVGRAVLERAVLVHEVGHLLGLINIGYKSPRDHEDPEHPTHSRNQDSVMFWAAETDAVSTVLPGGPTDDFDADDRADLADRAAGKL